MGGQASRLFMTRRNGQIGIRLRTFCSASRKSDSIWSSCKAVAACTADPTIHSARGRCTSGRVTPTRFIASTAPMTGQHRAQRFLRVHSHEERIRRRPLRPHTNRNQGHRAGHAFSWRIRAPLTKACWATLWCSQPVPGAAAVPVGHRRALPRSPLRLNLTAASPPPCLR